MAGFGSPPVVASPPTLATSRPPLPPVGLISNSSASRKVHGKAPALKAQEGSKCFLREHITNPFLASEESANLTQELFNTSTELLFEPLLAPTSKRDPEVPLGPVCRGPRTAFLLAGASYSMTAASLKKFQANVIESFNGTNPAVFVYVKAITSSHAPLSPKGVNELRRVIQMILRPTDAVVESQDLSYAEYINVSAAALKCLNMQPIGKDVVGKYLHIFSAWWSTMQYTYDLLARHETRAGFTFETVVFSRCDLTFTAPIGSFSEFDPNRGTRSGYLDTAQKCRGAGSPNGERCREVPVRY